DSPAHVSDAAAPAEFSLLQPDELALLALSGEDAILSGQAPGAVFGDLQKLILNGNEAVRHALRDATAFRDDKFAQLTAARWKNGAVLHVPAGVKLAQPVRVSSALTETENHIRHLVMLEEGAEAVLFLESWSGEKELFVGELLELRLAKDAKLHLVTLQTLGSSAHAMLRQRAELGENAELKITSLHFGGKKSQLRQQIDMVGQGALCHVEAAAFGMRDQHFDFWLDMHHKAPKTTSEMNYWFVMNERARAVFNGLIQIAPKAADCVANQKSKSLLIGNKATVNSIPKLIIQTDAVKCSHGASISSVNPEQVHYLQSRGIPKREAERMIIRGFAEHVLDRIPGESFHARASAALDAKERGLLQ
ncbi:MAG: SufB/SufD family protein, partial [Bdellovibrionota bacterium]